MHILRENEGGKTMSVGYEVGHYMPVGGDFIFKWLFRGTFEECIKMTNFLNGGEGVLPISGWYKGVPVTPE
jgi:hypothetical protein